MKITKSEINFDTKEEINKALSQAQGNSFQLEDISSIVQRTYLKPKLLTALLNPMANEEFEMSDTFKYDETFQTAQLPAGKAYQDHGPDLKKDRPQERKFSIPSFGIKYNVAPQDYMNRRKAGSVGELLTEADVVAQVAMKAEDSWSMFDELGLRELIVNDNNIVRGGPFTQYDFYDDIVGGARPAATNMDLGAAVDHIAAFRKQRKLLQNELAKAGDSASRIVCICGDTFFNSRYEIEKQETIARDLRSAVDLVSQAVPTVDSGNFLYDMFESHDGITYINYGSEIIAGTKLVGDDDAYLIPMGASNLIAVAYAPAQTRQYVNTQALQSYAWSTVDDRQGVTVFQEANKLFCSKNPRAIVHLTSTTAP